MVVVLYDIENENIISRDVKNLADNINPEHKYFGVFEPFIKPDYDPRYYDYKMVETPVNESHPENQNIGKWVVNHNIVKRQTNDILLSLTNTKRYANNKIIDIDLQSTAFGLLLKKVFGIELTEDENLIIQKQVEVSNKILYNNQLFETKKALILQGNEPNLDEGWEN